MSEWISVKDRLPEHAQDCLIAWAGERSVFEAEFGISSDGSYWSFVSDDAEVWHPTHWMPLPEPPEDV